MNKSGIVTCLTCNKDFEWHYNKVGTASRQPTAWQEIKRPQAMLIKVVGDKYEFEVECPKCNKLIRFKD